MLKIILTLIFILLAPLAEADGIKQSILDKPFDATNIQFSDDANVIHNLSDYKGKVVLVNFWATWCEPCVHEMPAIARLASFMEGKDVEILPISIDFKGVSAVKQFYNEQKITNLPILIDDKGKAFKEYKLQALPTTLVIDRKGRVIAKIMGEIEWESQETIDYLLGIGR